MLSIFAFESEHFLELRREPGQCQRAQRVNITSSLKRVQAKSKEKRTYDPKDEFGSKLNWAWTEHGKQGRSSTTSARRQKGQKSLAREAVATSREQRHKWGKFIQARWAVPSSKGRNHGAVHQNDVQWKLHKEEYSDREARRDEAINSTEASLTEINN